MIIPVFLAMKLLESSTNSEKVSVCTKKCELITQTDSCCKKTLGGRWDRRLVSAGMEVIATSVSNAGEEISFFARTN